MAFFNTDDVTICIGPQSKMMLQSALDSEIDKLEKAVKKWRKKGNTADERSAEAHLKHARALQIEIANMPHCLL